MPEKNGTKSAVVEQLGEDQFLTWGEATEIKTKRVFVAKFGKYIEYKTSIPLDMLAGIQAKFPGKDRGSTLSKMIEIMKAVMIMPPVTEESSRAVAKSDAALVMQVIGDVMPDLAQQAEDDLGEA